MPTTKAAQKSSSKATQKDIAAGLAKATGVSEADVKKVLEKLGYSKAVKNVASIAPGASAKVSLENAKIAFRIGRNGLVV